LWCTGPKLLHSGHSRATCRQSLSIPGQKYWSWRCSFSRSTLLKWPMDLWVDMAISNPSVLGMHSVRDTLSFALVDRCHSLPHSMWKPCALCLACQRSDTLEPASRPNKWQIIGSKKTSPLNQSSNSYGSGGVSVGGGEVLTDITSLRMPHVVSHSSSTDQAELSDSERLRFCHIRLRPSATGFSMPGRCRMLMILWARIDSFQRLWCMLIFSFSKQAPRA
jgi:hypothetical protein